MPPAAIGTIPPTTHTLLTSTRAPRPHGTTQEQPAALSDPVYSCVQRSKAVTMASPQPVVRRSNNPGAVAARARTRPPLQTPPPGKALAVHESRAAAGLFRQVGLFRGRAHVEGAPLVRRGSGFGGASCAAAAFEAAAASAAAAVAAAATESPPSQRRLPREPTSNPRGCPRGGPTR